MQDPPVLEAPSWVRDVTRDAVRHFAWGVGDNNPLWLDPDYARRTRFGEIVAPPCFPYAVHESSVAPGYDDRPRIYHTVDWRWFDVIRLGAPIAPAARSEATDAPKSDLLQAGVIEFGGESPVASARVVCRRPEAGAAPVPALTRRYHPEELAEIESAVLGETRRGAETRFFEDTAVGAPLGPRTKGPLSIMDLVAWCAGTTGVPPAQNGASAGGLVDEFAGGPQVTAWFAHLITDWAGDEALLHRLKVTHHAFPGLGSTTVLRGTVSDAWHAGPVRAVDVELRAVDQDERTLATGSAVIALASRDAGPVPLPFSGEVDRL